MAGVPKDPAVINISSAFITFPSTDLMPTALIFDLQSENNILSVCQFVLTSKFDGLIDMSKRYALIKMLINYYGCKSP